MPEAAPAPAAADTPAAPNLTPEQGQAKLEKMLGKGVSVPAKTQQPPQEPPEEEEPDAVSEDTDDAPDAGPDEVEEPDNAAVEGDEAEEDQTAAVRIQLDGETVDIPLNELPDHVMMRRDYTQKTQQLAQHAKALDEHMQAIAQERQLHIQRLQQLEQNIAASLPAEPNWDWLAKNDERSYWRLQAQYNERNRQVQQVQAQQQQIQQLQQMDFVQKLSAHVDQGKGILTEQIPGWRDPDRQAADKAKLRVYAQKQGFTPEEIDHAYDARLVVMVHKARLYDELTATKPKPRETLGPPSLRPGVATHPLTAREARVTKAKRRVAQTGRPEDGIAALEAMLSRR